MDIGVDISYNDVVEASKTIENFVVRTPCRKSILLSKQLEMEVYLKHEYKQQTSSFKERGARNALMKLTSEQKLAGVITASSGNLAQGLSYHGMLLNIPVTVCMPVVAPTVKVEKCVEFGAKVISVGANSIETSEYAKTLATKEGLKYICGSDDLNVIAGQGTVMKEILEDVPDVDAVIVSVGGGGLLSGTLIVSKSVNQNIKVVSVETEICPALEISLKNGSVCSFKDSPALSCAEGLAVCNVGKTAFQIIQKLLDKHVVVSERHIPLTLLKLIEMEKCVVEGSGAVGLTAALDGHLEELKGKKVAFILSGGNIDTSLLIRSLKTGLYLDKRLVIFQVTIPDKSGSLHSLSSTLKNVGASVISIKEKRVSITSSVHKVKVEVEAYIPSQTAYKKLKEELQSSYEADVKWKA